MKNQNQNLNSSTTTGDSNSSAPPAGRIPPVQFAKPRSDSILYALSDESQARVVDWLFKKNLSCDKVVKLCKAELDLSVSETAVYRFYHRELSRRNLDTCLRQATAPASTGSPANPSAKHLYSSLLDSAALIAQQHAKGKTSSGKIRVFTDCLKLLIASRREAGYSRRTDLARQRFEFDAATACVIRQIQINEILADDELTDEERIRSVREQLFGPELPE